MSPSWIILFCAGLLEICWAIGLKYTEGFTRLWPSVATAAALFASIVLLAQAAKTLPIGTAYMIWVGIGALGTAVLGIFLFNESASPARLMFLALMMISIAGLKLSN